MAGFEVTPPRPSSSTRRLSSPPEMRVRRMKSSQTDWPYCRRAATGLWTAEVRVLEVPITSPSCGREGSRGYRYRLSRARTLASRRAWRSPAASRAAPFTSGLRAAELLPGGSHDVLRVEAELLLQLLERSGGA